MDDVKILSFDQIIAAQDVEEHLISVPEWGGAVKIRSLTKAATKRMRREAEGPDGKPDPDKLELLMLSECLTEPKITVDQAAALSEKAAGPVERILKAIVDINGWGEEAQKEALKSFRSRN